MNSNKDSDTIRPDSGSYGNNNVNNGSTIRPNNSGGGSNGATIRPNNNGGGGSNGATIRPNNNGGGGSNGATIRPNNSGGGGSNGATIRPNNSGGGGSNGATLRPNNSGGGGSNGATLRPSQGGAALGGGSTLRPDTSGKPVSPDSKTQHPDGGGVKMVQGGTGAGTGIAQADSKAVADVTRTYEESYVLNGIRYKVKRVISESSGEAVVLLVENGGNDYVLKLYYPGVSPNHSILDKVKSVRAMNLLVATVDHGVWCLADNKNGREVSEADRQVRRDFELMLYYP